MEKNVTYTLPLTTSTGKARVKRREENFGEPISVKGENKFTKEDYIEWQISYFMNLDSLWIYFKKAKDLNKKLTYFKETFSFFKPEELIKDIEGFIKQNSQIKKKDFKSKLKNIFNKHKECIIAKEHKNNQEYVMFELADLFKIALKQGVENKNEVEELLRFNENKGMIDIEKQYKIRRTALNKKISEDFICFEENYPVFVKNLNEKSFVEIQLKHKQKAVGYQSMIYFCVWLNYIKDHSGNSVIGRSAKSKELIDIKITKEEIIGIAKAFMIASQDHNIDIKVILKEILKS